MRILMVGNFLSAVRGNRFYCEDLVERLAERNHQVLTTSARDGRLMRLMDMVVTIVRKRAQYEVAVVDVYSGPGFVLAEIVSAVLNFIQKPFVLILHGGRLPDYGALHPIRMHRLLKSASLIATPSLRIQKKFIDIRNDIVYLPNGINLDAYHFRLRTKVNPKICWIRAFNNTYNPMMAIETFEKVLEKYPNAKLTMVGPIKDKCLFNKVVNAAKLKEIFDKIDFHGPVKKSEIPNILSNHDVFLNTTNYESFGVAVMEAAACGIPIVSTKAGELPHLWQEGEEVLLVPIGCPQEMANCVCRLLEDPDLAASLSYNARKKAEKFAWAFVLPQFDDFLGKLKMDRAKS